jgi:hypothetical protein
MHNHRLIGISGLALAAATVLTPIVSAQAQSAPVATFGAPSKVPVDLFRSQRIFIRGSIEGRATDMIVDSGAGMTVLDTAFAESIGLGSGEAVPVEGAGGNVPGRLVKNVDIAAGSLRLDNTDVLVIDLAPVARAIGRPIPMVLGRDAFAASIVTIDFPNRTMHFREHARFQAPAGSVRVPLGKDGGLHTTPVTIGDAAPVPATFDLGNPGTVLISRKLFDRRPDLQALPYAVGEMGGVGGIKPARRVTLPSVTFAGEHFVNVPVTINEDAEALPDEGANVGLEMLKAFVVHIDFSGGAMHLVKTGVRGPFPRDRAGMRTELAGDRLRVAFVGKNGPAAKSGFKVGDEIVAIDGVPVDAGFYRSANSEWHQRPAGERVALTRADGRTSFVMLENYF